MIATTLSQSILTTTKATRWLVAIITWVAFLLRTFYLGRQSLWRDEVDAILFSSWGGKDLLLGLTWPGHNGPLYFLLLNPWRTLLGNSEFTLRYPAAMMGVLLIPLSFAVTRQLGFSRRVGIMVCLLLATSPYLVWYGQEAKMYTALAAFIALAFIAHLRALTGHGPTWWIVFVIATSISFYLHILAPLMLAVYTFIALLMFADFRRRWRPWLLSMACLTLPYVPLVLWQLRFFVEGNDRGHPFYPFRQQFYVLLQLYSSGLIKFVGLTAAILFVFLFLCGLFLTNRRAKAERLTPTRRALLAAWALGPPLLVYLISLRVPVFEDRYIIYITPPFYLIVALGIVLIRYHSAWLAALCLGLVLTINLTGIWQQQRQPIKADFRAAAQFMQDYPYKPTTVMVQMPYLRHTFKYYYGDKVTLLEGLWTNNGKTEAEVDREMAQLTANLTDLWLVISEGDTWDSRHLVQQWLNDHGFLIKEAHFTRVDVYYYQFQPGTIETPGD